MPSLSAAPIRSAGMTVAGFSSLEAAVARPVQSVQPQPRWHQHRRRGRCLSDGPRRGRPSNLLGSGECSDAYHISAPRTGRQGRAGGDAAGARRRRACAATTSAYINLHGTGTPLNDAMEGKAVAALFGASDAVQLDQGDDRPCAGRRRCLRGGLPLADAASGLQSRPSPAAASVGWRGAIPKCRRSALVDPDARCEGRDRAHRDAQQLVRLRRQQRRAGILVGEATVVTLALHPVETHACRNGRR